MVIAYGDTESVDSREVLARIRSADKETPPPDAVVNHDGQPRRPAEIGEDDLLAAMRDNRFSIGRTAQQLGISRSSLYALIERSRRLRKARDIGQEEMQRCLAECGGDLNDMVERLEVSEKALKLRMKELGLDRES